MTRALVTGATGFIGPHLIDALQAGGTKVVCLARSTAKIEHLVARGVEIRRGDLRDPETLADAVAEVDEVYHLAGMTKAFRHAALLETNAAGARHIAQACAQRYSPPVLVLVSSLAAAGPSPDGHVRDESEPARPVSQYGKSKLAGELEARKLADRVPMSIVRPPIVFGPGDRAMWWMFKPIANGGMHTLNGFKPQRFSLIDARDLAQGLILVARGGRRVEPLAEVEVALNGGLPRVTGQQRVLAASALADGRRPASLDAPTLPQTADATVANDQIACDPGRGIYFIADVQRPTYAELGWKLGRALGRTHARVLPLPKLLTWVLGAAGEVVGRLRRDPMIINWDKAREATAGNWVCDTAKIRDELGFAPARSLDARLAETAEWYRNQGWL